MKKLLSVALIALLVLMLTACGQGGTNGDGKVDIDPNIIAKVNGESVLTETFTKTFALVEYNYKKNYGDAVLSQEYNGKTLAEIIKLQILDNLILDVLRINAVKSAGGTVDAAKVNEDYTKYYEAEVKDNEEVRTFFEAQGIDEAFIKSQIETQLYKELYVEQVKNANADALKIEEGKFNEEVAKVRARHILVDTKEEADKVVARIQGGEKFEEVAKEVSTDTGSGAQGGDLGFFMRGDMVAPFEEAAFSLAVGQVSAPVESQFGFHIIRVDEVKKISDLKAEATDEAKKDIETVKTNMTNTLLEALLEKETQNMLTSATVERFEQLLETQPETQPETTAKP